RGGIVKARKAALAGAVVIAALAVLGYAQQPGFTRKLLQDQNLSVPGRHAVQALAEFVPGGAAGRHTHPGEELGYVVEGTLLLEGAQATEVGPADAHRARAQGQALDEVGAAPESAVDQYRDAAAHGFDDLGQGVDGGAAAVLAARAVVGDDQAVEAVFHAQRRVLVRQDALDEDLHARDLAHPLEEIPGHVRRFHAGHARQVDAVVVGPAPRPRHDSGLVAVLAIPGVLAAQPEQSFLVAARHAVHGHDQHRAARGLGALDQRAGDVPAGRAVELKPDRSAARLGGVLGRRGG